MPEIRREDMLPFIFAGVTVFFYLFCATIAVGIGYLGYEIYLKIF